MWFTKWQQTAVPTESYSCLCLYILKRAKYHPSLLQFSSRLNCTEAAGILSKTQSNVKLEALDLGTFISFAVNDRDINFMCTSSLAAVHSNISIFFPGDAFRLTWAAKYVVQYQPLKEASIWPWSAITWLLIEKTFLVINLKLDKNINTKGKLTTLLVPCVF